MPDLKRFNEHIPDKGFVVLLLIVSKLDTQLTRPPLLFV